MKPSSANAPRKRLDRTTAKGCFASNLAMPGLGTLAAGRPVGYAQLALAGLGLTLSLYFGTRFIVWGLQHWAELQEPPDDIAARLRELWVHVRWALAGLGAFGVAWFWALLTGFSLLSQTSQPGPPPMPPRPPPPGQLSA